MNVPPGQANRQVSAPEADKAARRVESGVAPHRAGGTPTAGRRGAVAPLSLRRARPAHAAINKVERFEIVIGVVGLADLVGRPALALPGCPV